VCYRQGFREDRFKDNKIRQREAKVVTRCGCETKCTVHVDHINQHWYVSRGLGHHKYLDHLLIKLVGMSISLSRFKTCITK
jgi:hypothetical protein